MRPSVAEAAMVSKDCDRLAHYEGRSYRLLDFRMRAAGYTTDEIDEIHARFNGGIEVLGMWGSTNPAS